MPKSQKKNLQVANRAVIFIDYKPAELHKGKEWRVEYYAKIPAQNELKRFRKRVPVISPKSERLKYAKKMVVAINQKLENGWSPFYEIQDVQYKSLQFCTDLFLQYQEKEVQDGIKRPDTVRSYKSFLANLQQYVEKKKIQLKFIIELDTFFIQNYLDYLYFEKKNSPRTYNNHLRFLFTFLEWCKNKRFVNQNAAESIKPKPKAQKKRDVLDQDIKSKVKSLQNTNFHYYILCMVTYYCFIRRTELTKLKVSDVNLHKSYITIASENSKNRKTENVTIPTALHELLVQHLAQAKNNDYLFSANGYRAGKTQLNPKKISDEWAKFRKINNIDSKFQFYSLKDTGITDLLNSGIPAIKVRDQARHHDLKITETYTARNKFADEMLKNSKILF